MRDVNVELLTTGYSKKANTMRVILFISIVLLFMLILLPTSEFTISLIGKGLMAFSFIGLIYSSIWLNIRPNHNSIGKLTFTTDGIHIISDTIIFFKLDEVKNCKISIQDYNGKPKPSAKAIFPYDGTMNIFWLNKSNSKSKYRFKLLSKQHSDRLIDIIELWQARYPEIKLKVSWW